MKNYLVYLIVFIVLCVLLGLVFVLYIRKKKRILRDFDLMEGREFEFFCADLLQKRGFLDVEVTKGSGDYGVDILAEKDGVTYAIQCKRYEEPIGVKAVQEVYAGKDYYDRMVGVVMSNQYFTKAAADMAGKLKVMLWDRGYLEEMIEEE
ncbi:MAG: restriction endonuclease [Lachnospiraceae bacterium]|nr:restriction endonuclease [Lachnospiraceae bacterium]